MKTIRQCAEHVIESNPEWYHSIELAPGVVTPGRSPIETWRTELQNLELPDLTGKSVLDIGAYDGFFSFAAEQMGAGRVTALDHYVWATDMVGYMRDWRASAQQDTVLPPPHQTRHWRPDELPGRRPFDAARAILRSKVEPLVGDFTTMDLETLGPFDVVLFLGVLYHLEDPLGAMRRVMQLTAPGGLAVVESEAIEIPRCPGLSCCEFLPGRELNHDPTNWWIPNAKGLQGLCSAAGFHEVSILTEAPRRPEPPFLRRMTDAIKHLLPDTHLSQRLGLEEKEETPLEIFRYRIVAHAIR